MGDGLDPCSSNAGRDCGRVSVRPRWLLIVSTVGNRLRAPELPGDALTCPSSTSPPIATTSSSAVTTPTPPATVTSAPSCVNAQLHVAFEPKGGAGGTEFHLIEFKNLSSRACSVHGFPRVTLLTQAMTALGADAADARGGPVLAVVLSPGQLASSTLVASGAGCQGATPFPVYLRILPPATSTAPTIVKGSVPACGPALSPITPGTQVHTR